MINQTEQTKIDEAFLALEKIRTAPTPRESELADILTSVRAICQRKGQSTAWKRLDERIRITGIGSITAKTFRVLPSDTEPS